MRTASARTSPSSSLSSRSSLPSSSSRDAWLDEDQLTAQPSSLLDLADVSSSVQSMADKNFLVVVRVRPPLPREVDARTGAFDGVTLVCDDGAATKQNDIVISENLNAVIARGQGDQFQRR
jgi:hypothetical protein